MAGCIGGYGIFQQYFSSIKLIRNWIIKDTMLVSFDIKFIRRDQKQRGNGEACVNENPVEPDKLDIKRHGHGFLFIMHHYKILKA